MKVLIPPSTVQKDYIIEHLIYDVELTIPHDERKYLVNKLNAYAKQHNIKYKRIIDAKLNIEDMVWELEIENVETTQNEKE